jgi:hypothetical protein
MEPGDDRGGGRDRRVCGRPRVGRRGGHQAPRGGAGTGSGRRGRGRRAPFVHPHSGRTGEGKGREGAGQVIRHFLDSSLTLITRRLIDQGMRVDLDRPLRPCGQRVARVLAGVVGTEDRPLAAYTHFWQTSRGTASRSYLNSWFSRRNSPTASTTDSCRLRWALGFRQAAYTPV